VRSDLWPYSDRNHVNIILSIIRIDLAWNWAKVLSAVGLIAKTIPLGQWLILSAFGIRPMSK